MTKHAIRKLAKRYQDAIVFGKKPVGGIKATRSRLNKKHHKAWRVYMQFYYGARSLC